MMIRDLNDLPEFIAGDGTILREFFHPDKDDVDFRYSFACAAVKKGQSSAPHKLSTSELYYILEGTGIMCIDGGSKEVRPGQAIYIPPGSVQNIKNTGDDDLKFICIVDPAWRRENEEILSNEKC